LRFTKEGGAKFTSIRGVGFDREGKGERDFTKKRISRNDILKTYNKGDSQILTA